MTLSTREGFVALLNNVAVRQPCSIEPLGDPVAFMHSHQSRDQCRTLSLTVRPSPPPPPQEQRHDNQVQLTLIWFANWFECSVIFQKFQCWPVFYLWSWLGKGMIIPNIMIHHLHHRNGKDGNPMLAELAGGGWGGGRRHPWLWQTSLSWSKQSAKPAPVFFSSSSFSSWSHILLKSLSLTVDCPLSCLTLLG